MSLTYFIQSEILNRIGTVRIARFFQDFAEDLKAAGLAPPDPYSRRDGASKGQRIGRECVEGCRRRLEEGRYV